MGDADQRSETRLPARIETGLRSGGEELGGLPRDATLLDLSRGGAFIETSAPFVLGDMVSFSLQPAPNRPRRTIFGRVRWIREGEGAGIGVKFVRTRSLNETLDMLSRYIRKSSM